MRHQRLDIIECGASTCASAPGVFCRHLSTAGFGSRWVCDVYGNKEVRDENGGFEGWLQRLPECLAEYEAEP